MEIGKGCVVTFHHTLRDETGTELETSRTTKPNAYLHGAGNIILGLERALLGHREGDQLTVTLEPRDAYGLRNPGLEMRVSAKRLGIATAKLQKGTMLRLQTKRGPQTARVTKVGRFMVDLDGNHALAGKTLTFDIDITEVRVATEEELAHGHAHGPGGHHHD